MPNWLVVDDADRQVAYSSGWSILRGSSRQWAQAVHSTSQTGATATFMFKGRAVFVVATIPAGSGTSRSQYSVDGSPPTLITLQAGSQDSYGVTTFLVEGLAAGVHTIVVSNQGGSVPFQLDKFQYLPHDSDTDPSPIYPDTNSPAPSPEPVPEPPPAESPNSSPPVPTSPKTTPNNPSSQQPQQPPPTSPGSPPNKEPVSPNISSDILSPPPSSPTPDTAESLNLGEDRVVAVVISNNNGISTMIISGKAELDRLSTMTGEGGSMTVMKVLPSFTLITRTDSTGGVTVETKVSDPSAGALAGPSLSINEIIGISLGCLAFLGFAVIALIFLLRRRRMRSRGAEHGKRSESRRSFGAGPFDASDENAGPSTVSTPHITPRTTENLPVPTHEAGSHRRSTDDGGQSGLGPLVSEASSFYSFPRHLDPPPAYRHLYGGKESL